VCSSGVVIPTRVASLKGGPEAADLGVGESWAWGNLV